MGGGAEDYNIHPQDFRPISPDTMVKEAPKYRNRVNSILAEWFARAAVGMVFVMNVWCAAAYLANPDVYAPTYGLAGATGRTIVQAFGVLFLMWNATYPPVMWMPRSTTALFAIVLIQQAIGLAGETWLLLNLPAGQSAMWATGTRFAIFDGSGLVLMLVAFVVLRRTIVAEERALASPRGPVGT
jgi:hypothetical protein